MIELLVVFAKTASEEYLLTRVKEGIAAYEKDKTKENRNKLNVAMDILSIKIATEGTDTDKVIKAANQAEKITEILKQLEK